MWADENVTAVDPQERDSAIQLPALFWALLGAGLTTAVWALIVGVLAIL